MKFLIIIDMQNDFIVGSLENKAAEAIKPAIIEKIRNTDAHIIATRDTHYDDYLETQEGKYLPVKHCIKGTIGWNIDPEIQAALEIKNADIIDKVSFGDIELPETIRKISCNEKVEEITLCGTCTGICVISNAIILKAAFPEAKIIVDGKCCACVTEESHTTALNAMRLCQVEVV